MSGSFMSLPGRRAEDTNAVRIRVPHCIPGKLSGSLRERCYGVRSGCNWRTNLSAKPWKRPAGGQSGYWHRNGRYPPTQARGSGFQRRAGVAPGVLARSGVQRIALVGDAYQAAPGPDSRRLPNATCSRSLNAPLLGLSLTTPPNTRVGTALDRPHRATTADAAQVLELLQILAAEVDAHVWYSQSRNAHVPPHRRLHERSEKITQPNQLSAGCPRLRRTTAMAEWPIRRTTQIA